MKTTLRQAIRNRYGAMLDCRIQITKSGSVYAHMPRPHYLGDIGEYSVRHQTGKPAELLKMDQPV